ncbi:MAG: radical SAM protein [Candidatus Eremiobacteraeota bacterium]|nr:radical SAM protein [Candidatus Eremiobacteraeota bacterium]
MPLKQQEVLWALQADRQGEICESTSFRAVGRSGTVVREPLAGEVSPAPYGTLFFFLPGRFPLGICQGKTAPLSTKKGAVTAVSLIPPPGYTRTLLPAWNKYSKEALPFYAYSMGALQEGEFRIAAIATENSHRWDPTQYNSPDLKTKIKKKLKAFPRNRLLSHLSHCATEYGCYNAQNIFYDRWEGGIPVAPSCNADCAGCISKKRAKAPPSPQQRIAFVPTAEEITEVAVAHLKNSQAIVSFGQGCEGEPTTQAGLLIRAITLIRERTSRGTININTNGSKPEALREMAKAGLDSIRVSLNSALESRYESFFRPSGFSFATVRETLAMARGEGLFISLNLFIMPGVTDNEEEVEALFRLLREHPPHKIQLRNLNMDPDLYFSTMPAPRGRALTIPGMLELIRKEFPTLTLGNFTPSLRE